MEESAENKWAEPSGITPWLRWAGGKRALVPRLLPEIMALKPRLYIEPFLGGGAVALALPADLPKILADVNPHLIDCWLCMRNLPGELFKELDDVRSTYGDLQTGYIKARAEFNKMIGNPRKMWARRSALLMFLNARCFNGLWRTNSVGQYNVPFGKLEFPRTFHWDNDFSRYHAQLFSASLYADHFAKVLGAELTRRLNAPLRRGDMKAAERAMEGVAIYADPPYDGTFDGYAKDGFGEQEQRVLATMLANCATAGAAVWASNNDTPLVREIYDWAQIEAVDERHSVGATGERRGKRGCVLIRGGAAIR